MDNHADAYETRKLAGEEPGDMLAEEARLNELGLGFPLNRMYMLYYEGNADEAGQNDLAKGGAATGDSAETWYQCTDL